MLIPYVIQEYTVSFFTKKKHPINSSIGVNTTSYFAISTKADHVNLIGQWVWGYVTEQDWLIWWCAMWNCTLYESVVLCTWQTSCPEFGSDQMPIWVIYIQKLWIGFKSDIGRQAVAQWMSLSSKLVHWVNNLAAEPWGLACVRSWVTGCKYSTDGKSEQCEHASPGMHDCWSVNYAQLGSVICWEIPIAYINTDIPVSVFHFHV